MMTRIAFLGCLLICFQSNAQDSTSSSLSSLSKKIINENNSDSLNVVSIFNWITDNIEYDVKTYLLNLDYPNFEIDKYLDSASYMKAYNRKVSEMVISNKKAICDGYSRLFLTLCERAEIKCTIIIGKVRFPLRDELAGHAWNAVLINNQWHLIDLTWASGYVSRNSFVKEKNSFFYLTPPKQFIADHYPNDLRWSLLDNETANRLFYESPIQSHHPFESGLTDYAPKSKTIAADTVQPFKLTLQFNDQFDPYDISINGWPMESLSDKLNLEVTLENRDSLEKIYPNLSLVIPKIEIIERRVVGDKIEFTILPLNQDLKQLGVYIDSSWPSLVYEVEF